ncbi:MAG TPA: hypothetical protein VMT60_01465, partial [Candidatus Bathyarchaeia archaeon]|nr:hypothetical protein [Candidatus Bathyarchaeia archaeon]
MNNTNGRRILGAGITLALVLCARSPLAQENPSARISALGGLHVSGIIPDLYTDLTVNPANAVFADKLSINYDRRGVAGFTLDIPNLGSGGRSSPSDSYFANEVSVWGLKLSSWRAAIFAQWRLGQSEHNTHDYYIYNSTDVRSRQQWGSSDGDIGRIDLIAARALGDHSAFGARLQIRGYYLSSSDAGVSEENYYFDNMIYVQPQTTYKSNDASSLSGRKLSVDVQAGLLKRDDGESRTEVALEASVHPLDYKKQTVSLDIREQYNPAAQLTNYDYSRIEWSDDREGNLWALGLFAGHTFGSGIRLYAGASVSTASYDAAWNRSQQAYEWSGSDEILSGAFSCDGSMRGASCFLKGGRKFELGDNLDLYLGLHGAFEWNHAEEDPVIRYTQAHRDDTGSVVIDQPSTLEYTGKRMNLYLPLSIEFR